MRTLLSSPNQPLKGFISLTWALVFVFLNALLLGAGCGNGASTSSNANTLNSLKRLPRMGYSIQIGAFSKLTNAVRATENLQKQGLDAYYYVHRAGLYKVRFGDFPSRALAREEAEKLRSSQIINAYYIVRPEDYAVVKNRKCGKPCIGREIVRVARTFLGVPYRFGSTSATRGFDCSGFVMTVYRLNGLRLPRSSKEQWKAGVPVRRGRWSKGDLVFFAIYRGKGISHVGIYVGKGRFIHAPSRGKKIQISSLSIPYFKTRYRGARTYF